MLSIEDLDKCAAILRDNGIVWKRAKAEYEGLREVRYYDLEPKMIDTTKLGNVLGKTADYVHSIDRGAANCFTKDTFVIDYTLCANLLGKAVYGEISCVGLLFRVNWVVKEVVATFYTGKPRKVKLPNDLRKVVEEGKVRNLAGFAAMTGLDERHVGGSEAERLLCLFQAGGYIQCKLTRLIKGCLIYLDHLESGAKTYVRAEFKTLHYNVKELLAAMDYENTAYVYTEHETSSAYNLILYAMCQQYPSPIIGGVEHVKIPADGDVIFLVGYYPPTKSYRDVVVSPKLVMNALVEYSKQFGLEEDLESAMIIACSLRQNRYLEKVGLPAVHSNYDLIYAGLSGIEEAEGGGVKEKRSIYMSEEATVMFGRFHQMCCLVLFKDFDTSFRNTRDRDWTMRSILRNDIERYRLIEYMEDQVISSGILQLSNSMLWLSFLRDDESLARLRKFSVFEGFWLVKKNPHNVLKDGMIRCLKRGVNDMNQIRIRLPGFYFDDSFEVLMKEVVHGGGDSELEFANGSFNVSVSFVSTEDNKPKRIVSFSSVSNFA